MLDMTLTQFDFIIKCMCLSFAACVRLAKSTIAVSDVTTKHSILHNRFMQICSSILHSSVLDDFLIAAELCLSFDFLNAVLVHL